MKAIVAPKYGGPEVLQYKEVDKPSPIEDEVLVKIHASSLNAHDFEILRGALTARMGRMLTTKSRVLGSDVAGCVEAVGENVEHLQPGDEIVGDLLYSGLGAFAEYVCAPEKAFTMKPASMTFEEAATYPQAAIIALQALRDKRPIQPGQKVLINGAGGGMGTFGIQLAKFWGAEVTAVDSGGKFDMLQSIGADHLIDYKKELFTERGETYDVIFDVVGVTRFSGCMNSLNENGIYLQGNGSVSRGEKSAARENNMQAMAGTADYSVDRLNELGELHEAGTLKAVIDRVYPLEQMVEVHRFVEQGDKLGNVVVTMVH